MKREREFDAHADLCAAAEARRRKPIAPQIDPTPLLQRAFGFLGDIADRLAPLLALCGLLFTLGYLADVIHTSIVPLHLFWALIALVCAVVAMRAFWSTHK